MTHVLIRSGFDKAVAYASKAAAAYYDTDSLLMTDEQYDALLEIIQATKAVNPDWDDKGLTTKVAGGTSIGGAVQHPEPMLSLSKTKDLADIENFAASLNSGDTVVEVKLDGLAVRAEYVNAELKLVVTRGDGLSGEDVTAQALAFGGIQGLPKFLNHDWTGEVRGEVFMSDTDFETANLNRIADGGKAFVNPRNATAGALRKVGREYETPMTFGCYDISGDDMDSEPSYSTRMLIAEKLGVYTARWLTPTYLGSLNSITDLVRTIEARRPTLGFPIDGAVIKADHDADRDRLGTTGRVPRWATSYKYAADTATTTLLDIETAIGRSGRLTLRARLDPVFVGGTTNTYATLHNPDWVAAQGLAIGQQVVVQRAGDVIPRVTAPLGERSTALEPWQPPEACHLCNEPWDKSSVLWRCHTPDCSITGRIAHFAKRDFMDIDGLSDSTAEALAESGLVSDVADLYDLSLGQLSEIRIGTTSSGKPKLLGLANAGRIFDGLEASKDQPLNRVIGALGLRFTGRTFGRRFAAHFKSLEAFRDATLDELQQVDGVRDGRGPLIFVGKQDMIPVINRLIASGLTTTVEESAGPKPLAGETYVVSGSVPGYTRTTIAERIEALGGRAASSVSKTTTALVTDDPSTSKGKKAISLGIPIIDPVDFLSKIDGV